MGAAGGMGAAGDTAAAAAAGGTGPAGPTGAAGPAGATGAGSARRAAEQDLTDDYEQPASPRRPRSYNQHLGGPSSGPDWERPRRYEAYPTIRTRVGLPPIPRIAVMAAALGIAAIALFFLPALLGLGSPDVADATPSPTAAPSRSIEPTPTPEPTPVIYVIKGGDTLSKIASEHGLTLDELMAANPDITDPNRITEGQQIIIPVPQTAPEQPDGSAAPSAGASP
jgi:LysM domain-containing protein